MARVRDLIEALTNYYRAKAEMLDEKTRLMEVDSWHEGYLVGMDDASGDSDIREEEE